MGKTILAVDAGNTKTIALIVATDGTVVGAGRSGCGDIYGAGSPEAAFRSLEAAVTQALQAAGAVPGDLLAGGFNMAGADWPEDFELLDREIGRRGWGHRRRIVNDAIGGMIAGSPDGTGVGIILGTAEAIGARGPDGRIWHGSFWLQSFARVNIVQSAFQAVYEAELGMAEPTALTDAMLKLHDARTVEEMLHGKTRRSMQRHANRRELLSAVFDAADQGDAVAVRILRNYGDVCGDFGVVAARRVGYEPQDSFPLVCAGGMLRHPSPLLREIIGERFRRRYPNAVPIRSKAEPVLGAAVLGFEAAGLPLDRTIRNRMEATAPGQDFFET
jgi:N-acetylglucosamine kinase-like BadF-type ATPase